MSSPVTPISGARQLVLTERTAQDYLVQVVLILIPRVERGEVVLDGEEIENAAEPETWTAKILLETQLAHGVTPALHLPMVTEVAHSYLLIVDLT